MKKIIFASLIACCGFCIQIQAAQSYQTSANPNATSSSVTNVSTQTFQQTLASTTKPIILVFSASWCKPCQTMKPLIEEVAREMPDATFLRIDFDSNTALAQNFHVDSIPAVLFIRKDGYIADRVVGYTEKQQLKDRIGAFISSQQQR